MRKRAWLTAAAVLVLILIGVGFTMSHFAGHGQARASGFGPVQTRTEKLTAGGRIRGYEVMTPARGLSGSAPILVMLSGYGASVASEISRDDLTPYVRSGQAELVYPVPVRESWNADGCCGYANDHHVDDVAFLTALAPRLDPGGQRPLYLIGFSNGARLAYRIACTDPGLFDAYAMIKGVPMPGCTVRQPVTLIEVASVDDPEIPYKTGDHGLPTEKLPVTTEVTRLHDADRCPGTAVLTQAKDMTVTSWTGCADGTRLSFAVWPTSKHLFPRPPVTKQAAAPEIWAFLTRTKLAPLP